MRRESNNLRLFSSLDPFCQNSELAPDFGQERKKKQSRFESETKCGEDRTRRLIGPEP